MREECGVPELESAFEDTDGALDGWIDDNWIYSTLVPREADEEVY